MGCDFLDMSLPSSVGIDCATGSLEPSGECTRIYGDAGWTKRLQSLQLLAGQRKFGRVRVGGGEEVRALEPSLACC
jgi:hypothetical protein